MPIEGTGPKPIRSGTDQTDTKFSPDPVETRAALRAYIKDRVGNIANRLVLEDESITSEAFEDFRAFINAMSEKDTRFFYYKDSFTGDTLIVSSPALDKKVTFKNNPAFIAVEDKVTELPRAFIEKVIDIEKVKTKLGRIKEEMQAGSLTGTDIGESIQASFKEEEIAPKNS